MKTEFTYLILGAVLCLAVGRYLIGYWWKLKREFYINIGE